MYKKEQVFAAEVLEEVRWLVDWCDRAAYGDGGQTPRIEIRHNADGWWFVEAASFDDGHADVQERDLLIALREAKTRLTTHPEREREDRLKEAAWGVARVTNLSLDEALALLREHQKAGSGA